LHWGEPSACRPAMRRRARSQHRCPEPVPALQKPTGSRGWRKNRSAAAARNRESHERRADRFARWRRVEEGERRTA
jgi:hypothetical protein